MRSARNTGFCGVFGDMASLVKHLPHYQEPATLILLKGHLLVEELLRGYIDRKLPNPSAFKHEHFSFAKALMLCRALSPPEIMSWAFDAASKLNDARNQIAHELEPDAHHAMFENFFNLPEPHTKAPVPPPEGHNEARLYMAVADLHNELISILHETEI